MAAFPRAAGVRAMQRSESRQPAIEAIIRDASAGSEARQYSDQRRLSPVAAGSSPDQAMVGSSIGASNSHDGRHLLSRAGQMDKIETEAAGARSTGFVARSRRSLRALRR